MEGVKPQIAPKTRKCWSVLPTAAFWSFSVKSDPTSIKILY
jgi:hypothetical protein